jgi:hypothetical protein
MVSKHIKENIEVVIATVFFIIIYSFGIAYGEELQCSFQKNVCADFLCLSGPDFMPIRLDLERCDNDREQLGKCKIAETKYEVAYSSCQKEVDEYRAIDELQQRRIALAQTAMKEYEHIIEFQQKVIEDLRPKPVNTFLDILQKVAIGVAGFFIGKGL